MASTVLQSGGAVAIKEEGVTLSSAASSIDFVGNGVTAAAVGNAITTTISGTPGTSSGDEVPTGTINSSNKVFTLAHTPVAGTLLLTLNGAKQTVTTDYTLSTATITFVVAPTTGSTLTASYYY